ncbi:MAG: hypothetical protein QXU01_01215 [Candidatus Hadarchaeales archaeon]
MMLHLIIADAELETVPPEIAKHKVITWYARKKGRKPTEIILNSSLHYQAMRKLPDYERRGRPDIVHFCLLTALDSPLNMEGLLRVYVHTRQDKIITVDPTVNLPRMYNRFEGLMEQLFLTGRVPPEHPLLILENGSLRSLLNEFRSEHKIVMTEKGRRKKISEVFKDFEKSEDVCVIVGGFPHGDFLTNIESLNAELVSIYEKPLTAPTVVSRVITAFEQKMGIL